MLTDKQRTFCEEYIIDLNATQAAIRAGYSEKTAGSIGDENLKKPEIQSYLSELMKARSERLEITSDMVLRELAKIGFSDIANYYEDGFKLKQLSELDKNKSGAVSQIKVTEIEIKGVTTKTVELKLHDKLSALEKVSKHIGFFEKDNTQKKSDIITPETLAQIANKINNNASS
jgi:phage terminase small subunit